MKLIEARRIPTPFGGIVLPVLETPPIKLPVKPDEREKAVIKQGIGEDLAMVFGFIPVIGDIIEDFIEDTHHAEIKKMLSSDEYSRFAEFNKSLPTTLALMRSLLFNEV